jgi:hypothetical protein
MYFHRVLQFYEISVPRWLHYLPSGLASDEDVMRQLI